MIKATMLYKGIIKPIIIQHKTPILCLASLEEALSDDYGIDYSFGHDQTIKIEILIMALRVQVPFICNKYRIEIESVP